MTTENEQLAALRAELKEARATEAEIKAALSARQMDMDREIKALREKLSSACTDLVVNAKLATELRIGLEKRLRDLEMELGIPF